MCGRGKVGDGVGRRGVGEKMCMGVRGGGEGESWVVWERRGLELGGLGRGEGYSWVVWREENRELGGLGRGEG